MTQENDDNQNPPEPEVKPKSKRWRFWLLTILAVLVLLPILLVGLLLLALRSETGTAWVIDQIPGLEVRNDQGSLLGLWQADQLTWRGYGVGVQVDSPLIDWSPTCLAEKQFCLDTLRAESIDVTLQDSGGESSAEPISLPEIDLPVSLAIDTVDLGPLTLNQGLIWDRLQLSASGSGADWKLARISFKRDDLSVDLSGRLQTRRDWPLDLGVQVDVPPPYRDEWLLDLNLTGSVEDLRVRGQSKGYLNATLSGRLAPLDPALPAQLRVQSDEFVAAEALPSTLTLLNTDIALKGSLEKGFKTEGTSNLPGNAGKIDLALNGLVTTLGVQNMNLRLASQADDKAEAGTASITGDMSWEQAFTADAKLNLDAFPWYNLIPGMEPPPVELERFSGDLSYDAGSYQATFEAVVDGPQGVANLSSAVNGDLESLTLSELRLNTGAGFLGGTAKLGFADVVKWQANLELSQFNPGYWLPQLEASLNGEVTTEGRLNEGKLPTVKAAWDLTGNWRANEAELKGRINRESESLRLQDFDFRIAENRVTGQGVWGPKLSGQFNVAMPSPELFLPQLEGKLNGQVSIAGSVEKPAGKLTLNGQSLGWDGQAEIESLNVSAELAGNGALDGQVSAQSLKGAGQSLEALSLDLSGRQGDHRLDIRATHEEAKVYVSFTGGFSDAWNAWTGQLARGEIDVPDQGQFWKLSEPASLAYSEKGKLTFGAHCWRWQEASVCGGQQVLMPDASLDYRVRNFPTTALAPLLPAALKWDTLLNAELVLEARGDTRTGSVTVDAGSGSFSVRNKDEWEEFQYTELTSSVDLKPGKANLSAKLSGPKLGDLSVAMSVDPQTKDRNLDGRFNLAGLDISMAAVFAGLEEVKGKLNGEGQISGPLMKPAVTGELALTNGQITDPSLPMPLEDMVLTLTLNGYNADVSGRWKSNARSSGELDGNVSWESDLVVDLQLTGERLPFNYEPYASVELAPDLNILFKDGSLNVSGRLAVPRGSIEVTALPEQAVTVSDDEVIVGAEPEEPALQSLNMDVTVVVGEDTVTFNAFGLTGDLEGTLRIGNEMDTRGSLQLVDGKFQKYGQDLDLRKARILFTGPIAQPYLDIEAIRRVDTVVAGLRMTGPVTSPQTEVFSEPEMPQTDALSYLILGRAPQSQGDEGQMRNAAISLGLKQASKVTQGLGEEIGIRELTLEAEGSGDSASVVASGYLTEDLSLRYGVGLFEPITTVALRYDIGRYFYLEAASGLAASLDLFYTRDF